MLDMYRGASAALERSPVDVVEVVNDVARMYRDPFAAQGITIGVAAGAGAPCHPRIARQVEAGVPEPPPERTRRHAARGDDLDSGAGRRGKITVEVADTGTGIAPEHLGRIFDAFFTTKKEVSGVGLGLSVTHAIVHQHGGTITVASTAGRGTRFTITLPSGDTRNDQH